VLINRARTYCNNYTKGKGIEAICRQGKSIVIFFTMVVIKQCKLHPRHSLALTQVIGYAKRWANHQQLAASEHKLGNLKVAEQSAADALHQLKLANSWINQRPLLIKLLVLAHVHQYIYLYICLKFIISFFFI
jgi:hypothetical protein